MKKYTNKHWLREKEYISLLMESDNLCSILSTYRNRMNTNQRMAEVNDKLNQKFFNEYRGRYRTAPKWYRKNLNRSQRAKSKQTLYRELQGYDVSYEDNYKNCSWYW
jgi:hypothetical protein